MRRAILVITVALIAACNNKTPNTPTDAGADASTTPDASCFTNPKTHDEIINACTDAQKIFKASHPPLLNSDGSLPPLP